MDGKTSDLRLPRVLGPVMAAALVVGTVIGSGVFKKAQNVADRVPEFGLAMLAWVLGGVLALFGALALAEVAVLIPRAGGNYVFLREGFGRLFGFLWGWVDFWIIRSASIAALAAMFTESLHDVLKQSVASPDNDVLTFWTRQAITVSVIAALAFLNSRGTRLGGAVQVVITSVKVGSLVGIALLPFLVMAFVNQPEHGPSLERLGRIWPEDWSAVDWSKFGAALVGVLWAYHGWMNIGPIAEEVRNPSRTIPLAVVGGVFLLIALYLSVNIAYYLVIPRLEIAGLQNTTVATEFSFRLLGTAGAIMASAAVMTSVFGSLNGNLLVGPRLLFAMGRDGLAFRWLSRLHPAHQTPAISTYVLAAWSALIVLGVGSLTEYHLPIFELMNTRWDLNLPAGKSPFDVMTDFAIFGAVAMETLAIATIFVHRIREPNAARPYRCWGYPVVPIVYCYIMLKVMENMIASGEQRSEAVVGLSFIIVGALVYRMIRPTKSES